MRKPMRYRLTVIIENDTADPLRLLERLQDFAADLTEDEELTDNSACVEDIDDDNTNQLTN